MCHHYCCSRNPLPEHLADEFSIRSSHDQMMQPERHVDDWQHDEEVRTR
jgi:hypothetical protein